MKVTPTALVVDDELDLAWALQQTLILDGWKVFVARTGGVASKLAATAPVHIAFVDAKLPDMDGRDVAKCITELQPDVMVYLISGYYYPEDREVREGLHQHLFAGFISKPLDLSEISRLAQHALGRQGRAEM